jgi:hypothetical protein
VTKYRKRRLSLLWLLLCLYGAAFLGSFWDDHGVTGDPVARANNIQCQPNWFLLGTRWDCSATVTDSDGKQYRFTSDSSLLTPADIGTTVPMMKFPGKKPPPSFSTARDEFTPKPWNGIAVFVLILLGLAGAAVLWPWRRSRWPTDRDERLAEARRLRAQWPKNLAIGILALYGAYFVHGVFVTAHINDPRILRLPTDGTGMAQSCSRDWRYLGAMWHCTVEVTPQSGTKTTQSMGQFTPQDIGRPKPVTLLDGVWEAVDQPYENRFAKAAMVLLLLAGTVIAKPLSNLQIARRLENTDPGRNSLSQKFLR